MSSVVTNLSKPERAGAVPSLICCWHHRGLHEAVLCIILHCAPKTPVTTLRLRTRLYIQIHHGCRCFLAHSYIYTRPSNITYINNELETCWCKCRPMSQEKTSIPYLWLKKMFLPQPTDSPLLLERIVLELSTFSAKRKLDQTDGCLHQYSVQVPSCGY